MQTKYGLYQFPRYHLGGLLLDVGHHFADFGGRGGGALGQLAHFVGHHGKAPATFSGAGSFNGGVQGQQIGLVGNVFDGLHNRGDLLRALAASTAEISKMVSDIQQQTTQAVDNMSAIQQQANHSVTLTRESGETLAQILEGARSVVKAISQYAERQP
jgi:hypothetical protein